MRHANNEKPERTHDGRIRTTKPRKIPMLAEKEPYKYWGILEAEKWRWKKKIRTNVSDEQENYLKPNYVSEISSKE